MERAFELLQGQAKALRVTSLLREGQSKKQNGRLARRGDRHAFLWYRGKGGGGPRSIDT